MARDEGPRPERDDDPRRRRIGQGPLDRRSQGQALHRDLAGTRRHAARHRNRQRRRLTHEPSPSSSRGGGAGRRPVTEGYRASPPPAFGGGHPPEQARPGFGLPEPTVTLSLTPGGAAKRAPSGG